MWLDFLPSGGPGFECHYIKLVTFFFFFNFHSQTTYVDKQWGDGVGLMSTLLLHAYEVNGDGVSKILIILSVYIVKCE